MKRVLSAALISAAVVWGGCSSDERERADKLRDRSVAAEAKPLREVLISDAELDDRPAGSPERAFLEFWSLLQYQGWLAGLENYDPVLRDALGTDRILEGLKTQAAYFRSVRPSLKRSVRRDGRVTIRYLVKSAGGTVVPQSMTWMRSGDEWRIIYDPFLDEALRQSAQQRTQRRIDPTADEISPEAIRQGDVASRLQSRYLRTRLAQSPPP